MLDCSGRLDIFSFIKGESQKEKNVTLVRENVEQTYDLNGVHGGAYLEPRMPRGNTCSIC